LRLMLLCSRRTMMKTLTRTKAQWTLMTEACISTVDPRRACSCCCSCEKGMWGGLVCAARCAVWLGRAEQGTATSGHFQRVG
jgi:hypothetical protein